MTKFDDVLKERINFVMQNIGCTREEANLLVTMKLNTVEEARKVLNLSDASEGADAAPTPVTAIPKPAVSKSKINEEDISNVADVIKANFPEAPFTNKDLAPLVSTLGLTARQTPSRLKKLVEMGILSDEGGSPKKYKLA